MTTGPKSMQDLLPEEDPRLIAAYRGTSTDVPSAEIDAALRAAARRAVGARPQALGKFRLGTWQAPLAAAAIVVLSATVVFLAARDEGLDKLAKPAPSPSNEVRDLPSLPPSTVEPEASGAADVAPKAALSPVPMSSMATRRDQAITVPKRRASELSNSDEKKKSEALPAAAPPAQLEAKSTPLAEQLAKEHESPAAPAAAGASMPAKRGISEADLTEERRLPRGDALSKPSDAPAKALARQEQEVSANTGMEPAAPSDVGVVMKDSRRAQAKTAEVPKPNVPNAQDAKRWVERIEGMLREGNKREALDSLAAFRKVYPVYMLPKDLSELERETQLPR